MFKQRFIREIRKNSNLLTRLKEQKFRKIQIKNMKKDSSSSTGILLLSFCFVLFFF